MTPYGVVVGYQRFRCPCYHLSPWRWVAAWTSEMYRNATGHTETLSK